MKIMNLCNNEISKYPIQNICKLFVSNDDKYLFFAKDYSNVLYIYNITDVTLLKKKCFSSKYYIYSMIQCDNENIFIVLENRRTSEYNIMKYNFGKDIEEIINIPNLKYADFRDVIKKGNQNIYKFQISYRDDKIIDEYYGWKDGFIRVEDEKLFLNNYTEIAYSNDGKYYFVSYTKMDGHFDPKEVTKQSKLKVYDSSNHLLINLNDREFENELDIPKKYYAGHFTFDVGQKRNVFYTKRDNIVELYYFDPIEYKKIELDFDFIQIWDVWISFKNNAFIVGVNGPIYSYCYVYSLSTFL